MRKLMILTLLVSLCAAPALALDFDAKQFYVQGEVTFPMGDWGDFVNLGYGVGLGLLVPHGDQVTFGLEATYLMFSTEDVPGADVSWSMVPVLFLGQYHLTDSSLYLLGGLGVAFSSAEVNYDASDTFDFDESSSDFALALGAGLDVTPNLFLEGRFNAIADANQIGLHLGWKF